MATSPMASPNSPQADRGSAIAQASITGERVKGWLTSTLLALSIFVNVWLILEYRAAGTEQRLQQYNLDWFKTHEFSDLKGDVRLQEKLIETQCRR
jgi:hypothetical protein